MKDFLSKIFLIIRNYLRGLRIAFKGKKILQPLDKNTRPLKDLVKESILNILEYSKDSKINLNNSLVLDLFAGTGSFGLECIFFLHHSSHSFLFFNFKDLENSRAFLKSLNFKS